MSGIGQKIQNAAETVKEKVMGKSSGTGHDSTGTDSAASMPDTTGTEPSFTGTTTEFGTSGTTDYHPMSGTSATGTGPSMTDKAKNAAESAKDKVSETFQR